MTKHWCPVCDEGWVKHVTIRPTTHTGWLCSECEAFWPDVDINTIRTSPFIQFSTWLDEQGLGDEVRVVKATHPDLS
jgi:hypothetical protein